jgi:hypothetical protein
MAHAVHPLAMFVVVEGATQPSIAIAQIRVVATNARLLLAT